MIFFLEVLIKTYQKKFIVTLPRTKQKILLFQHYIAIILNI